jgi:hypothetical protein
VPASQLTVPLPLHQAKLGLLLAPHESKFKTLRHCLKDYAETQKLGPKNQQPVFVDVSTIFHFMASSKSASSRAGNFIDVVGQALINSEADADIRAATALIWTDEQHGMLPAFFKAVGQENLTRFTFWFFVEGPSNRCGPYAMHAVRPCLAAVSADICLSSLSCQYARA